MLNLLTESDKKKIEKYILTCASYDKDNRQAMKEKFAGVDVILQPWVKNKAKYLRGIFGDNLILKKQVSFEADNELLELKISGLLDSEEHTNFINKFYEIKSQIYQTERAKIGYSRAGELYSNMSNLLMTSVLLTNRWNGITFKIPNPKSANPIKVETGSKISKILGKIAEAYDIDGYEAFRIAISNVVGQKKIYGTLCLSIHPLDYMTMSDNDNDWTSCMSWKKEGCYRQGTVEMMNSPMVVVAYLESSKNMTFAREDFWNNKKWRELLVINKDLITRIKGYPYTGDNISIEAIKWLKDLAEKTNFAFYDEIEDLPYNESFFKHEKRIYISAASDFMYNDFGRTKHIGCLSKNLFTDEPDIDICFNYSGPSECMICGETNHSTLIKKGMSASKIADLECQGYQQCSRCNSWHKPEDLFHYKGEKFCHTCEDSFFRKDMLTNEKFLATDLTPIHILNDITSNELKRTFGTLNFLWADVFIYISDITKWNEIFTCEPIKIVSNGASPLSYVYTNAIPASKIKNFVWERLGYGSDPISGTIELRKRRPLKYFNSSHAIIKLDDDSTSTSTSNPIEELKKSYSFLKHYFHDPYALDPYAIIDLDIATESAD